MGCCDDDNFDTSDGVAVQDEGGALGTFTTLNFVGAGVTATDAGGGVAQIDIPGGTVDTKQVFRYVVVGGEANPLTITLPAARASANYNVMLTMARTTSGATAFKDVWPLTSTYTINDFDVEAAVALEVGDILQFTVEDLT